MKILYAVQGTGNGHLSRACAMAQALGRWPDLQVDWLVSGRPREQSFGVITEYQWRKGLTFVTRGGSVRILDTLLKADLRGFLRDVAAMDFTGYDLVVCDFEPVVAHAARRRGLDVIGIGHQYAFNYPIPLGRSNAASRFVMRHFAPVSRGLGLHWHHFGFPILPPIVDIQVPERLPDPEPDKVIVYLPFESAAKIDALLEPFKEFQFYVYHPEVRDEDRGRLRFRGISRDGFKRDLLSCSRVISNSGFELIGECLQLGKAILTKPLTGQMEQHANAKALAELGYAEVVDTLAREPIRRWLESPAAGVKVDYPDVAAALAQWIAQGGRQEVQDLSAALWRQTGVGPL